MRIVRGKKGIALLALAATAALALAAGALAVFPNDSVTHYAGCLNTNVSPGGTFTNVAVGETPSKPCGSGQVLVHLSGGDITAVQTASGSGLTGGKDNGAASLALDSTGCSSGGVLKWNGTSWSCGSDNNTSYSAGAGLDLSGTTFSVKPSYQLPQSCSDGQVAKSNGSNSWSCQNDNNSPTAGYAVQGGTTDLPTESSKVTISTLNLADPGSYLIMGTQGIEESDDGSSGGPVQCYLSLNGNVVYDGLAETDQFLGGGTAMEMAPATVSGSLVKVEVECEKFTGENVRVHQSSLAAIKLGSLQVQSN
jgi:hypothetical protein